MTIESWKPIATRADLPTVGTEESEHLDFKKEPWAPGEKGSREIARDVAQFANHLGGSIVVGAVDTGNDRLSRYVAVPQATNVAQRVADVCDAALSPRVDVRSLVVTLEGGGQLLVVNVMPHDGVVAIKIAGKEQWEFFRRDGKGKRAVSFEEVEHMWTQGRRGKLILLKVPVEPTQDQTRMVLVDAHAGDATFLREPARLALFDDHFEVTLHNGKSFGLPYEFVRAAWPSSNGRWVVSVTAKFELVDTAARLIVGYSP